MELKSATQRHSSYGFDMEAPRHNGDNEELTRLGKKPVLKVGCIQLDA